LKRALLVRKKGGGSKNEFSGLKRPKGTNSLAKRLEKTNSHRRAGLITRVLTVKTTDEGGEMTQNVSLTMGEGGPQQFPYMASTSTNALSRKLPREEAGELRGTVSPGQHTLRTKNAAKICGPQRGIYSGKTLQKEGRGGGGKGKESCDKLQKGIRVCQNYQGELCVAGVGLVEEPKKREKKLLEGEI